MPAPKEVLLAPFFKDVEDYDCRVVELERDVTCGDLLAAVARELKVRQKDLALVGSVAGVATRFQLRDSPVAFMQIKGLPREGPRSLADLPSTLRVRSRRKRTELTLDQCLKIQAELLTVYSSEVFVLMMAAAQAECRERWRSRGGGVVPREYQERMRAPLEWAQQQVMPRWGYEASAQGMLQMQFHFAPWDPLPQVSTNVDLINRKIGFDFAWAETDHLQEAPSKAKDKTRNFGTGGQLKMLFLYGGGTNGGVAKMQCANIFKESPMFHNMQFSIFEAPHEGHVTWHRNPLMQQQLRPYGETIYLYFDRVPHSNSQHECLEGIDDSLQALRKHLRTEGPYDGVVGFDMGGEVLLQAARLQQQGDQAFQGMFRFMILFTTSAPRTLGNCKRPVAPLDLPAILSWSDRDENHPYPVFEEASLLFAENRREIIRHEFGHVPPRWSRTVHKDSVDRLTRFLNAMWAGAEWEPTVHPDNTWAKNLVLPLQRLPSPAGQGGTPRRLLILHDPMGAHDFENLIAVAEEALRQGHPAPEPCVLYKLQGVADGVGSLKQDLAVSTMGAEAFRAKAAAGISVEAVLYDEKLRSIDWHEAESAVRGTAMMQKDLIRDADHDDQARALAGELMKQMKVARGERIGVVGLGTGGFIALALSKVLIAEATASLMGLWLVDPPMRIPDKSVEPGSLGRTPVTVLVHETSSVGPPWCYEVSTSGPFAMDTFRRCDEMTASVVKDFAAVCDQAEAKALAEAESLEQSAAADREMCMRLEAAEKAQAKRDREQQERTEAEQAALASKRTAEEEGKRAAAAELQEFDRKRELRAQRHEADWPAASCEKRCQAEMAKPRKSWETVTIEQVQANHAKLADGMHYGLVFPWTAETLQSMGPAWLTKAFHAAGTLASNNRVLRLTDVKEHIGGGACSKLVFDVEYDIPSPELHTELFAKIPFPLSGKTQSDRLSASVNQQGMDWGEINAYRLLESRFPFHVPKYYFGDISNETSNFILITERIRFGSGVIEPAYDKMKDRELRGPAEEYYYLLVRLGAQLAGRAKAGSLAPLELLHSFCNGDGMRSSAAHWGVRPESSGITKSELAVKLKMGEDFISNTGRLLFPEACTSPTFLETWKRLLTAANAYSAEIDWWCHRQPDYVAWGHANMNVDNAWFWRKDGELGAGLLDWGAAGCSSLGAKLWYWLYCCEYDFLTAQLDGLLRGFREEYYVHGGPLVEVAELRWQLVLTALKQGVGLLGALPQIYRMCPKKLWPSIESREDPRIFSNIDGKNTLRVYIGNWITICRMVQEWDIVESFDAWAAEVSARLGFQKKTLPT